MIFEMPLKFDLDEWYVLGSLALLLTFVLLLPKRFPPVISLIVFLWSPSIGMISDYILGTEYPFNFYDTMDTKKYDLFDFILYAINYSLYGYLFLYFYDKYQFAKWRYVLYILSWATTSVIFEGISTLLGVYKYNNWNLAWSFVVYLIVLPLHTIVLKTSKSAYDRTQLIVGKETT